MQTLARELTYEQLQDGPLRLVDTSETRAIDEFMIVENLVAVHALDTFNQHFPEHAYDLSQDWQWQDRQNFFEGKDAKPAGFHGQILNIEVELIAQDNAIDRDRFVHVGGKKVPRLFGEALYVSYEAGTASSFGDPKFVDFAAVYSPNVGSTNTGIKRLSGGYHTRFMARGFSVPRYMNGPRMPRQQHEFDKKDDDDEDDD